MSVLFVNLATLDVLTFKIAQNLNFLREKNNTYQNKKGKNRLFLSCFYISENQQRSIIRLLGAKTQTKHRLVRGEK